PAPPRHPSSSTHLRPHTFSSTTHLPPSNISPLSLHDALPILIVHSVDDHHSIQFQVKILESNSSVPSFLLYGYLLPFLFSRPERSEEHTSELQSRFDLVCRLLLGKKKDHPTALMLAAHTEPCT